MHLCKIIKIRLKCNYMYLRSVIKIQREIQLSFLAQSLKNNSQKIHFISLVSLFIRLYSLSSIVSRIWNKFEIFLCSRFATAWLLRSTLLGFREICLIFQEFGCMFPFIFIFQHKDENRVEDQYLNRSVYLLKHRIVAPCFCTNKIYTI